MLLIVPKDELLHQYPLQTEKTDMPQCKVTKLMSHKNIEKQIISSDALPKSDGMYQCICMVTMLNFK